ncbi:MAG: hypothetical protein M1840_003800 [Geoglossum simile]|nr:MAG: hypothetical protein M1840_003800 [Geoglossum simile]
MAEGPIAPPVNGPRIVLALDYGTTYTGLAWINVDGQTTLSEEGIKLFQSWPGRNASKVPSTFSYSRTRGPKRCKQWGYDIGENSLVMQWTKLELEPRTAVKELDILRDLVSGLDLINELRADEQAALVNNIPRHITKDAEGVVRDYLSKVSREWYTHIKVQGRFILDRVPLDIVISHPASWSYEAINKTYRAVTYAFHRGMFPTLRNFYLTSEPEACALYTAQHLARNDRSPLIPGECFVLCDAGGGTVDLVSYLVKSIEPLKLTRVGGICGDKFGAALIDKEFLRFLESRVENLEIFPKDYANSGHFVLTPQGKHVLEEFERTKHGFNGERGGDITIPRGAILVTDGEDEETGALSLTVADVKNMFERSVNGTIDLIARQVVQVQNSPRGEIGGPVTNIFLSGGFAENEHLFREVKKFAAESDIDVHRADDCWTGVVKGALLRVIGIGTEALPKAGTCPRHYGICTSQEYAGWRDGNMRTITDGFDGRRMVPEQFIWLVQKGDIIIPNKPIETTFDIQCKFTNRHRELGESVQMGIAATALEKPPLNLSSLRTGTEIPSTLSAYIPYFL